MSTKLYEQPVLSALVTAYWVGGDMGLKQTSAAAWEGVKLTAEEIAVIVPVPIAVFDDAQVNLFAELRPEIAAAIARKLDAAVLTGADKPASWPTSIVPGAVAAGNVRRPTRPLPRAPSTATSRPRSAWLRTTGSTRPRSARRGVCAGACAGLVTRSATCSVTCRPRRRVGPPDRVHPDGAAGAEPGRGRGVVDGRGRRSPGPHL